MNTEHARKAELRRAKRAERAQLSAAQRRHKSLRAARHLVAFCKQKKISTVGCYLSTASELQTDVLLARLLCHGMRVLVPSICAKTSGEMRMVLWQGIQGLRKRRHGIREPMKIIRPTVHIELLALPLVAFDTNGNRLGNGGGYYDRWIAKQQRRPFLLGLAYEVQRTNQISIEPWDQSLDAVCTERGIQRFRKLRD